MKESKRDAGEERSQRRETKPRLKRDGYEDIMSYACQGGGNKGDEGLHRIVKPSFSTLSTERILWAPDCRRCESRRG